MLEYIIVGIVFSCIFVFFKLLYMRYFLPKMLEELKMSQKDMATTMYRNSMATMGHMAMWLFCWPAVLIYAVVTIIVWIIYEAINLVK